MGEIRVCGKEGINRPLLTIFMMGSNVLRYNIYINGEGDASLTFKCAPCAQEEGSALALEVMWWELGGMAEPATAFYSMTPALLLQLTQPACVAWHLGMSSFPLLGTFRQAAGNSCGWAAWQWRHGIASGHVVLVAFSGGVQAWRVWPIQHVASNTHVAGGSIQPVFLQHGQAGGHGARAASGHGGQRRWAWPLVPPSLGAGAASSPSIPGHSAVLWRWNCCRSSAAGLFCSPSAFTAICSATTCL